jgi:hypothetical protein
VASIASGACTADHTREETLEQPSHDEQEFASVPLKQFASIGIGLVIKAPASWDYVGTEKHFQLEDPETDLQFTASAYENPGIDLEKWAELRLLGGVNDKMPEMRPTCPPYRMSRPQWEGYVGEYVGTFPGGTTVKRYLVLALLARGMVVSATFNGSRAAFEAHSKLFRWLLQNTLDFYEVRNVDTR